MKDIFYLDNEYNLYDKEGNELGGVTCYLTPADVYLNSPAGE